MDFFSVLGLYEWTQAKDSMMLLNEQQDNTEKNNKNPPLQNNNSQTKVVTLKPYCSTNDKNASKNENLNIFLMRKAVLYTVGIISIFWLLSVTPLPAANQSL